MPLGEGPGLPHRRPDPEHARGDEGDLQDRVGSDPPARHVGDGPDTRGGQTIFITSIPYMVNKAMLVERIGEIVESRKLPPLVDVKDVSPTTCGSS